MRILWYNWRDIKNPDAGGAEVFTHEVCKRLLDKEGIDSITLFCASYEGCVAEETVDGIKIVRDGSKYSVYGKARDYYNSHKGEFDLVVDEVNTRPFGTPSFVKDVPIVALVHQLAREFWFYETSFPINVLGYYFFEKYWLSKYRDIPTITVSNSSAEDLKAWGFKKVHVVPQGLSFSPLQLLPEKEIKPTVLFVGRLKKAKKPDEALRAFRIIKDEIPDARMWFVGGGYMEEELKGMVEKMFHNDSQDVVIYGKQTGKKMLELMSRAHVLLVPGVREGWGLVVTEANAMGTPAVAYDVPGLRDSVMDGVTGTLVQSGDYIGMAIEAVELIKNHIKRKTYSMNGMKQATNYNWENTASQFDKIVGEYVRNPLQSLRGELAT